MRTAVAIRLEVETARTITFRHAIAGLCETAHLFRERLRDRSRDEVVCRALGVLGMVIIRPRMRTDLNDRQCFAVQHGNGEFVSGKESLCQDPWFYREDTVDRLFQIFFFLYDLDADGRAFTGGLEDDRKGKALTNVFFYILLPILQIVSLGEGHG